MSLFNGFTLIEILVVIGIIAILAAVVIIAINPARQFAQARNSQRVSNVNSILNAIGQRIADNKGTFPVATGCTAIPATATNISSTAGEVDLSCLTPTYIASGLPFDPSPLSGTAYWTDSTHYDTKYTVAVDSVGRYTVCAPGGLEAAIPGSAAICVTR